MINNSNFPDIISKQLEIRASFPELSNKECEYINKARDLFCLKYYDHSLIDFWNAAISNLRRRVEAYGVELWSTVLKENSGRKKYDPNGSTLAERWSGVEDFVLISGAKDIGLISKKTAKSLETIDWMRNHASCAHDSDDKVCEEDVIALVLLLQDLFKQPLPEPKYSISAIFDPIKTKLLNSEELKTLEDQIKTYNNQEIRTLFGFLLNSLTTENEETKTNIFHLFPIVWEKSNDDLRKTLGVKYHNLMIGGDIESASNNDTKTTIFELLVKMNAVGYIPEGTRARIYRKASSNLAEAKNTAYGWGKEESMSKSLLQLGIKVPSVAFEDVYQEILSVWCGNFWGRSQSYSILNPFIDSLSTDKIRLIVKMFKENDRVKEELYNRKPKEKAIDLLKSFQERLTLEAHKEELKETIKFVQNL
ncbi:hypothetical protein HMPREF1320_1658 [Capnocytophaga sp. oral taxon 335 str. F0486]|jgi:hypothetical protein|uniref:hypothetical protein n=1 Tax=Capnocytophaga sp. oral taxon 335 TaxID=712215 RepID=UPI00026F3673|nr:hypothetical protein [Capnocytophaga sp. oral taxon 335]EJF37382.1 hypothetical protein HMPREF1320_1658 [Capnocytophaga sp. oral taxon 335 str. F0486]